MKNKNTYLLIPSVPTPNGRLHLGHIGGPYLSADVLARYLRLNGHRALIITGTDSYESYVTAQAEKEQRAPEAVCHHYHSLIADDFKAMQIQVEAFINPLATTWQAAYQDWHKIILQSLLDKGPATHAMTEQVLWDQHQKRYLTGCWSTGQCPVCHTEVRGYFCEACGAHFRPEEIMPPSAATKTVTNLFLNLPKQFDLCRKGISHSLEASFQFFLTKQQYLLRLTANSQWGLPYQDHSVLFNYGFMFAYFLMLGEVATKLLDLPHHAFAAGSSVITLCSFGIDNAIPFLASALGITAACPQYKPFDYYLVNHFYYLNGQKFSTSRRHAIWVSDVIHRQAMSPDIIRLYLASINIRDGIGHMTSDTFLHYYNQTIDWIEHFILHPFATLPNALNGHPPSFIQQILLTYLEMQDSTLTLDAFSPHQTVQLIDEWLAFGKKLHTHSEDYAWWLKGFALFICPFMPTLGQAIWTALGYPGQPTREHFSTSPTLPLQKTIFFPFK